MHRNENCRKTVNVLFSVCLSIYDRHYQESRTGFGLYVRQLFLLPPGIFEVCLEHKARLGLTKLVD